MRTDNLLRVDAMNALIKELGEIETERFVYLLKREQFDYTKWHRTLCNDMTVDEVYKLTADREKARTTSDEFRLTLSKLGIIQSMNTAFVTVANRKPGGYTVCV